MTEKQAEYKRYLRCKHWRELRLEVLEHAGNKCEICGYLPWKDGVLQIHHKTYENRGNEQLDDLVCVCPRCHMEIHKITGKRKPH